MSKIRVRLLGGFEVWAGDRQVLGFEPQALALLAYLACHPRRAASRDHLAAVFWPDREPEAAVRVLRQALHGLVMDDGSPLILGAGLDDPLEAGPEVGLDPEADLWLDVEAFEEAVLQGTESEDLDPLHLTAAVQLYQGELLAGFSAGAGPAFEAWLAAERARLRAAAAGALHKLIESYRRRGEYRFGVHYARRLVALEPLSEGAHCELMRLSALAGQRNRALSQYEELRKLGVVPLAETRALHESILAEAVEEEAASRSGEPIGPLIPLAGRGEATEWLRQGWARVLQGSAHFTLVTGEGGVGKTRLIKSFLGACTSTRRSSVLKGRCYELAPLVGYQPFVEILRNAFSEEAGLAEQALAGASAEVLEDLVRVVPELRPEMPAPPPLLGAEGRRRLFGSVAGFLEGLCRGGDPLILFLDDVHRADQDTLDLLMFLTARLEGPVWIVAACRTDELDPDHPIHQIVRYGESKGRAGQREIERLGPAALEEIAESLVGEAHRAELAGFLEARSAGLPLAVTETINYLWDEGLLIPRQAGRWSLAGPLRDREIPQELDELIRLRIRRLPNSTKHLATLAAIMGQRFDVRLLEESAAEHVTVVEIGLEVLLKRWLIRPFAATWTSARRERDIVLWARGARRGSFEFAHKRIRRAVYRELNPLRRQAMHAQVAEALESLGEPADCEALAFHYAASGQWEKALPPLKLAVERALAVLALDTARRYCDQAIEGLSRLAANARNEAQAAALRHERERLREIRNQAVLVP